MKFQLDPLAPNGVSTITQIISSTGVSTSSGGGTNVTLAGEDYLSLSGQEITANPIDLDNLSAIGTPSSSTFLRGDNTWATPAGSGDMAKAIYDPQSIEADAFDVDNHTNGTTNKVYTATEQTKLSGIESGAEVNNISDANATDLTDAGDTTLHYHSSDRNRANHTGTQTASTISDFDTEVSNNSDVAANTAARHAALTVTDSTEIDFTLTDQDLTASLKSGSIDETKLDTSVNASLDLADSSLQSSDIGTSVQAHSAVLDATTASFTTADETKLDGIEALADVTDATNVEAAGATMNSDTSLAGNGYFLDEDDMFSNSATKVPSQQSVKAYVDAQSGGGTVDTIVAGNNIDVDSTDPANPIVSVETLTLADISDVTASAAELNTLDGITATTTELNYTDGVTSAIQTQIDTKAADNAVVKLTGNQTVAGIKTFSSSPIVPAPTTDLQAATKKYVDDNAGGSGDVVGPSSSEDNVIARFDSTTGKVIQTSGLIIDDESSSNVTLRVTSSNVDTALTLKSKNNGALRLESDTSITANGAPVVTTTDTQTLSGKTLTTPIISQISNTGTLTLPTSTDTLVGRATTDTLTNKTINGDLNTVQDLPYSSVKQAAWTSWSPTFSSTGGTPTNVSVNKARYVRIGNSVTLRLDITIVNRGSATGNLIFPLPVTALDNSAGGGGVEYFNTGVAIHCSLLTTTTGYIALATGSTAWTSGNQYKATLTYEAA